MEKCQSIVKQIFLNSYLDHFIDPSFQEVYRLFVSLFEKTTDKSTHTGYHLPQVDYSVMNDSKKICDQPWRKNQVQKLKRKYLKKYSQSCPQKIHSWLLIWLTLFRTKW